MASRVQITIDGVRIKPPVQDDFKISTYLVTDMKRNASGTMNGQILARKTKLFFKYPAITGAELRRIYTVLQSDNLFHTVTYVDDGVTYTKSMYVGEMPKTLARTGAGSGNMSTWIWKDVEFNLIER